MNQIPLQTLRDLESAIWQELQACARERGHAWRTAVLATTDAGGDAEARVVVLRDVEPEARLLRFFTDARSPKVAQIQANPHGVLVMWSPISGWQLRMKVRIDVQLSGPSVASRWAALKASPAADDYLSLAAPGSDLEAPAAGLERNASTACEQLGHLALLNATVRDIDWLEIGKGGHRRAMFGHGQARWVQP